MRKFVASLALMAAVACGTETPDTGGLTILNASQSPTFLMEYAVDETFKAAGEQINLEGYTLIVYESADEVLASCDGHYICMNQYTKTLFMYWPANDTPQGAAWVAWCIGFVKYGANADSKSNPEWFDWKVHDAVIGLVYDAFGGVRDYPGDDSYHYI